VTVVVAAAVVVVFTPSLNSRVSKLFASSGPEIVTFPVKPATLTVTVNEKGQLESAKNEDVHNEVEGTVTIISILAEGTRVKKGDLVCELDSATLKDNLKNQQITTAQAAASFEQAKLTREVAEVAVKEYQEGVYKQDKETILGEIALAKSDVTRSQDRLEWTTKMVEKGYVSVSQKIADTLSLDKAKFSLEQAQTKLDVLEKYTRDKTLKELGADVEKAKSDELAKKATFSLEKDKEAKLVRQIKACTLTAPGEGLVVYANDPGRGPGGGQQIQIEEGASVRERQKIFSLPDITQMRVNTKVHESMVNRVLKGQRARIRVDAFAANELTGAVQSIAPLPDANTNFGSDIKVYTTQIGVENGPTGLRPGMTAQVEILISQIPDVLSVPVQAVLEAKGKDFVYVKVGDGRFDRREVTLGTSNDKVVEVKTGIKSGEEVAMTPTLLLTDDEKRDAFGGVKEATKKDWGGATPPDAKGGVAPDGKGGPDAKDGAPKPKRKGGAGGGASFFSKLQTLSEDERASLRTASEADREVLLRKAGLTDDEIEQMKQMRANGGGGRGPGGGGGGGRPGGGPPQ
jgi:HlyD family secretion protein